MCLSVRVCVFGYQTHTANNQRGGGSAESDGLF